MPPRKKNFSRKGKKKGGKPKGKQNPKKNNRRPGKPKVRFQANFFGSARIPKMPKKGRSRSQDAMLSFSDYVQLPALTLGSATQVQGDVQLTPAFTPGTCIGVYDINPLTLSPVSIMRTRAYTFRKYKCANLKAELCPYEFNGANATVTQAEYAFVWDDNPDTRFASLGQTISMDTLRAHDAYFTKNLSTRSISKPKSGQYGSHRNYHVQATTDPENYIQTTLYVFQVAAALSSGTNLQVAKLFISGNVHFSEPTLAAIPGSMDIVSRPSTTFSANNFLVAPNDSTVLSTTTTKALPSLGMTGFVAPGNNLGIGFAWNTVDSEYTMSFPAPGNYIVSWNIGGISGTPTSSGTQIGYSSTKTSAASVSSFTIGNLFKNTVAVDAGGVGVAYTFYITITAPNQIVEFATASLGLTYASTGFSLSAAYVSTGFPGLQITLGEEKSDRISQLEEKLSRFALAQGIALFDKKEPKQVEVKQEEDPMLSCSTCQQVHPRCLHQQCLSDYHSRGHPSGMFFCSAVERPAKLLTQEDSDIEDLIPPIGFSWPTRREGQKDYSAKVKLKLEEHERDEKKAPATRASSLKS